MARGWESKDIENQQELRADRNKREPGYRTPEEVERERKLADLNLSRTRVLRDLWNAKSQRHREMIQESLNFLESEIARLTGSAAEPPTTPPR